MTCHNCQDVIKQQINKVMKDGCVAVKLGKFHASLKHCIGDTNVRIPIQTKGLCCMRHLLSLDRTALMTKVGYFYIQVQMDGCNMDEILYDGCYISANPKKPSVSLLDVCTDSGWKTSTFLRKEGDDIVFCYKGHQQERKHHYMSPCLAPPYYQISGGAAGGPIYRQNND